MTGRQRSTAASAGGFSLIELLIVVVMVGILASLSGFFYGSYITSANRTEARSALMTSAGALEKCKALYSAYNSANCNLNLPYTSETGLYTISGATTATTFLLTATPAAGKRQESDEKCTTLTLSQTGAKGATGNATDVCW